jgi:hypothetical protein
MGLSTRHVFSPMGVLSPPARLHDMGAPRGAVTAEPGALGNNDFVHQAGDSLDPDDAEPNEIHERGRRQPEQTPSIVVALGPAGSSSSLIQPNRIISTSAPATAMTALMLCSPSSRWYKDSATGG